MRGSASSSLPKACRIKAKQSQASPVQKKELQEISSESKRKWTL